MSDLRTCGEISGEFIVIHHLLMLLLKNEKKKTRKEEETKKPEKKNSCGVHSNVGENGKTLHPNVLIFYCKQAKILSPSKSFCVKICGYVICTYSLFITDDALNWLPLHAKSLPRIIFLIFFPFLSSICTSSVYVCSSCLLSSVFPYFPTIIFPLSSTLFQFLFSLPSFHSFFVFFLYVFLSSSLFHISYKSLLISCSKF